MPAQSEWPLCTRASTRHANVLSDNNNNNTLNSYHHHHHHHHHEITTTTTTILTSAHLSLLHSPDILIHRAGEAHASTEDQILCCQCPRYIMAQGATIPIRVPLNYESKPQTPIIKKFQYANQVATNNASTHDGALGFQSTYLMLQARTQRNLNHPHPPLQCRL